MNRYAMCLVEVVDCQLPWTGVAAGGEVTRKVTSAARPNKQLQIWDLRKVAAKADVPSRERLLPTIFAPS